MERLSIEDIIGKIRDEQPFHAVAEDYSFTLKIEEYAPVVCGAVHDGHQFRKELWENCLHTEHDRWYEEDPCTKYFVENQPIVLAGRDSRFEYDLNRDPDSAIYEDAWGKKLWRESLSEDEKVKSLNKHNAFYKVVNALIKKLEEIHTRVIVYDMHSYNRKRWEREVPVINLGTSNIDNERFSAFAKAWCDDLKKIRLPHGIETTAAINDTFQGNGYFLKYITQNFKNTLVLATEFSKIYCDELNGVVFPEITATIKKQLKPILEQHAAYFYKNAK